MSKIIQRIVSNAEKSPDKTAFVCGQDSYTYREFVSISLTYAHYLKNLGVQADDKILIAAKNSVNFAALLIAAADLGAVLVPVSPHTPIHTMMKMKDAVAATHLIAEPDLLEKVPDEDLSRFENTICIDGTNPKWTCLPTSTEKELSPLSNADTFPDDQPYILTMTSGSTGQPKPILLSQNTKILRAKALCDLYGLTADATFLAATPLYHSLAMRLVLAPLLTGATAILMPRFLPEAWIKCVDEHHASFSMIVSSQVLSITGQLETTGQQAFNTDGHFKTLISSSDTLPTKEKTRVMSAFQCDIFECYGTSEIAIATSIKIGSDDALNKTVGTPAPEVQVRILDENGLDTKSGEVGEIACKTPLLFSGYYQDSERTSQVMQDGYFKTGDLGRVDENGYLTYCGRTKYMIISGGINVYPTDIENTVLELDGVNKCAVFAKPHDTLGHQIGVAIVKSNSDDGESLTARKIRKFCIDRLADYQLPTSIIFVDELPLNHVGKLDRAALSDMYGTPN